MRKAQKEKKKIHTVRLFLPTARRLIRLLRSLNEKQWQARTCYPTWTVKDIAAHLLQTGISRLSRHRDGLPYTATAAPADSSDTAAAPPSDFTAISRIIAKNNDEWTKTAASLSTRVITELLAVTERELALFFKRLPPCAPAVDAVTWAGERQSENWLDIAREYTERWHHQEQIREAVGAPPLTGRRFLSPVLDILLRALPYWYKSVPAETGAEVSIRITGPAGGYWLLRREAEGWRLRTTHGGGTPAANITLSQDTAWKLLTRSITPAQARPSITFSGDLGLCEPFMAVKAIMMEEASSP